MVVRADKAVPSKGNPPYKYLVSACLAGIDCNYKGKNHLTISVKRLVDEGEAIALCPEVLGGLPTPRKTAEIVGGDGEDVLKKRAKVLTIIGKDVTKEFTDGARKALRIAKVNSIRLAVLKSKSPSCGCGKIYNGHFRKVLKKGDGVLTALLRRNKIKVYTEKDAFCA